MITVATDVAVLAQCESVTRAFGDIVAVRDASCSVRSGERIAVVGPSGSGKSTLLHLLGGIDTPTAGALTWPALGERDALRPLFVALIFQGPSLLPPLDVLENVALPLVLGGIPERDALEAARMALDWLGIEDLAAKLPEELSGGQAQRAAVARVIAGSPRLVLADEPTGQLDHQTAGLTLDVLDEAVAALGASLVLTTHDRRIADRLTTRWAMSDGRLLTAAA